MKSNQPEVAPSALSVQVGGGHYKDKAIQPVEYITANKMSFLEGCIVKRITRWRDKNGFEDLEKIKHEVDLIIELERRKQIAEELERQIEVQRNAPRKRVAVKRRTK